ncbi:uncharacterized protein METZ01_LOCUS294471, partial [marine metagenome]
MTLAIPGFLPDSAIPIEAFADQGTTNGTLYVSSTAVQGAQIVKIVVSDPGLSDPLVSHSALTMDFNSSTLSLTQVSDGSWVAYLADHSSVVNADAISSTSMDFGTNCVATFNSSTTPAFTNGGNNTWIEDADCTDTGAAGKDSEFTVLTNETGIVLAADGNFAGPNINANTGVDLDGWPFITSIDFSATNYLTYGDDTVVVTYGPEEAGTSISTPNFVTQGENVAVTITDNGLNIDPDTAETWTFTTTTTAYTTGSTTDLIAELDQLGFEDNGVIGVTDGGSALTSGSTYVFVETGSNTGVFTTHDSVGESTVDTKTNADVDDVVTLTYGGNTAQFVVATSNASASLDAGAEWMPAEAATYTVTDPDMNRNSSDAETLYISSDNVIPTIKIG